MPARAAQPTRTTQRAATPGSRGPPHPGPAAASRVTCGARRPRAGHPAAAATAGPGLEAPPAAGGGAAPQSGLQRRAHAGQRRAQVGTPRVGVGRIPPCPRALAPPPTLPCAPRLPLLRSRQPCCARAPAPWAAAVPARPGLRAPELSAPRLPGRPGAAGSLRPGAHPSPARRPLALRALPHAELSARIAVHTPWEERAPQSPTRQTLRRCPLVCGEVWAWSRSRFLII